MRQLFPKGRPINNQGLKTQEPQGSDKAGNFESGNFEQRQTLVPAPNFRKPFGSVSSDLTAPRPSSPSPVQAKLVVGQPSDSFERAADRVAARVVDRFRRPAKGRADAGCAAELRPVPLAGGPPAPLAANLGAQIARARSNGRPFPEAVRVPMEQAFGADFSGVKVHSDAPSDRLNASIGAVAFTTGQDIFFRRGAYAPEQPEGRELIAHELAHVIQQDRSPALHSLNQYVQRRLEVKSAHGGPALRDAAEIAAALRERKKSLSKQYGKSVSDVLNSSELEPTIKAMLESNVDEGSIDLDNEQLLCLLYLKLEGRIPDAETGEKRTKESELKRAETNSLTEAAALQEYGKAIRSEIKEGTKFYDLAILGAGASVAYYLSSSGLDVDLNATVIIGEEQPWEKQRGRLGVVNHPMNMIAPDYQGKDILEEGLASRQEFSKRVDAIIKKVGERKQQHVDSVKKVGTEVLYYEITSGEDVYYARRVVAGLGIGAQADPDPKTIKRDGVETKLDALPKLDGLARVMSMDRFQQAASAGLLPPEKVKKVVVVGANAAIDVMTTALRRTRSLFALRTGYDEIAWVASTRPAFLKGTDNEFVEKVYEAATEKDDKVREQKLKNAAVAKRVKVFPYSYLGVDVSEKGVRVSFGNRARKKGDQDVPVDTVSGDIMVYGIGPDVDLVRNVFKNIDFVPAYDLSLRFNTDEIDPKEVAEGIHALLKKRNSTGKYVEPDWAGEFVEGVDKAIGGITATKRPTEKTDETTISGQERVKEPLLRTLPAVVGLRAARSIKGVTPARGDRSSLEVIGGSAYRLADSVSYTYVSEAFKALHETRPALLKEALEPYALTDEQRAEIKDFLTWVAVFAKDAQHAARELESRTYERPIIKKSDKPEVVAPKRVKLIESNDLLIAINEQIATTHEWLYQSEIALSRVLKTLPDNGSDASVKTRRLLTGLMLDAAGHFAQLRELRDIVHDYGSNTAAEFMRTVAYSLPANVVLNDQLTASRSGAEALRTHMTPNVAKGVNLITSDATVIASHLAGGYEFIPAPLTQYLAARIVFDRRHLPLDEGAPLPRPKKPYDLTSSEFSLKQQREFQDSWMKKFKDLDALFGEMARRLANWTPQ